MLTVYHLAEATCKHPLRDLSTPNTEETFTKQRSNMQPKTKSKRRINTPYACTHFFRSRTNLTSCPFPPHLVLPEAGANYDQQSNNRPAYERPTRFKHSKGSVGYIPKTRESYTQHHKQQAGRLSPSRPRIQLTHFSTVPSPLHSSSALSPPHRHPVSSPRHSVNAPRLVDAFGPR